MSELDNISWKILPLDPFINKCNLNLYFNFKQRVSKSNYKNVLKSGMNYNNFYDIKHIQYDIEYSIEFKQSRKKVKKKTRNKITINFIKELI